MQWKWSRCRPTNTRMSPEQGLPCTSIVITIYGLVSKFVNYSKVRAIQNFLQKHSFVITKLSYVTKIGKFLFINVH